MKEMVLGGAALILALAVLRRLLRGRLDPRVQYALWLLAALRLLIPGALFPSPAALPVAEADPAAAVGEAMDQVLDRGNDLPLVIYSGSERTWAPSWVPEEELSGQVHADTQGNARYQLTATWTGFFRFWAPVVWLAGMAVTAAWLLLVNWRFYVDLYARRRRLRVPPGAGAGRLRVYAVEGLESPCLFGLFRPAVYVDSRETDLERLRHILTHEYTHYRHGDHVWVLVRSACLVVHWFDPLVWWAAAMSRRDCELACDAGVLDRLGDEERVPYGKTLLAVAAGRGRLSGLLRTSTAMNESKKTMKERILMIVKRPRMLKITLALVLVLAALAVAVTFGGRTAEAVGPGGGGPADDVLAEVLDLIGLDDPDGAFSVTWYARVGPPNTNTLQSDFGPYLEDALRSVTWERAGAQEEPDADHWTIVWPFIFYEGSDLVCWDPDAYWSGHGADDPEPPEPVWYTAPGAYDAVEAALRAYLDRADGDGGAALTDEEMEARGGQILALIDAGADPSAWIPLLRDLRWITAFATYDTDETMDRLETVMEQVYLCVSGRMELTDEQRLDILSANQDLDGAYAEYYEDIVWRMFLQAPDRFVTLLREGMDDAQRAAVLPWIMGRLVEARYAGATADLTDEEALSILENDPLLRMYVESPLYLAGAGRTAQIQIHNLPADGGTVTYRTDATDVATVDENGVVTAVGPGVATIWAFYEGPDGEDYRSLYCYVYVYEGTPAGDVQVSAGDLPAADDLVVVTDYIPSLYVDLKYATTDNFTGQVIYDFTSPRLRYGAVEKLAAVQADLLDLGYSLKIWDACRPVSAQSKLWEAYPDARYVSDPNTGYSNHSRGGTVDVTLVLADGTEIPMPSGFDEFSALADRDYSDVSQAAADNARLLEEIMEAHGFTGYAAEWWHYSDGAAYPVVED